MRGCFVFCLVISVCACRVSEHAGSGEAVSPEELRFGGPPVELKGMFDRIETFETTRVVLPGGKVLIVEAAKTPREREQGLMYRKEMPKDTGMLFFFERQRRLGFWMKNTFVDLDMVFIDAEKTITGIHADVPKSEEDTPEHLIATRGGYGKFVLELPAGAAKRYGLEVGQTLKFDD